MEDNRMWIKVGELSKKIEKLAEIEEVHWNQRARMTWLASGDKNMKLFHVVASQRKKQNTVKGLLNEEGMWTKDEDEMAGIINNYFEGIFSSDEPSSEDIRGVLDWGLPKLAEEECNSLTALYTLAKINDAMFAIHLNKALEVKDFRPISLCNMIYKVVSKVLVNRIRRVLNSVVDESQSAFVLGQAVTDNIMIGYECMHRLRNARRERKSYTALNSI